MGSKQGDPIKLTKSMDGFDGGGDPDRGFGISANEPFPGSRQWEDGFAGFDGSYGHNRPYMPYNNCPLSTTKCTLTDVFCQNTTASLAFLLIIFVVIVALVLAVYKSHYGHSPVHHVMEHARRHGWM